MSASKLGGAIVLIFVLSAWVHIALKDQPRLQVGLANGVYGNDCCGTVVFNDGIMTVANQRIGYVIEQDKAGPYVLPTAHVGASSVGFVIRRSANVLKLRLDDPKHPQQVELYDDGPMGEIFRFTRVHDR